MRKTAVAVAFGAAAGTYEDDAHLQRLVAIRLFRRISALLSAAPPLPGPPHILEIGCGTGFLTRSLRQYRQDAELLVTDLSAPMVAQCRRHLGDAPGTTFLVMDGEQPCVRPPRAGFDLVCASLALQWFGDPAGALAAWAELLRPGGHLAFATLAAGSLAEWRAAHTALGLGAGVPDYPTAERLAMLWPSRGHGHIQIEPISCVYPDGHAFLSGLRRIGAHLAVPDRRPLSPGALRRVLRQVSRPAGFAVTYQVAYGWFQKDDLLA